MTLEQFKILENIYSNMDIAWDKIADRFGFHCNGCKDNCCKSLFFHHTHIEKNFFLHGFNNLDSAIKIQILKNAADYVEKTFSHTQVIKSQKIMCPVNKDGLCLLYQHRPMICRLHGLPHEISRPGARPVKGPGCDTGNFDDTSLLLLDRTPFYRQMAHAEMTFRSTMDNTGKIKQTIAQMLLSQ